jgi:chromosome segregation ATPase
VQAQSEITELKTKYRIEQERAPTSGTKPVDMVHLRKSLAAAETAKRDLIIERDSKSAALTNAEKRLGSETRRREVADAKVKELTSKLETEGKEHKSTRRRMTDLEQQLQQCKSQLEATQTQVQQTQTSRGVLSTSLELQLRQAQELLRQATAAYGLLAQSTVPQEKFEEERQAACQARFRIARLERKLAEREKQAEELVWFTRQAAEEKAFLSRCLASSDEAFRSLQASLSATSPEDDSSTLRLIVDALGIELEEKTFALALVKAERDYWQESEHYRWIRLVDLVQEYSSLGSHAASLEASQGAITERAASLEGQAQVARVEADSIRQRSRDAEKQAARIQTRLEESEAEKVKLRSQLEEVETVLGEKAQTVEEALRNEQKKTRDLAQTVKEKMAAEKALIEDVEGCVYFSTRAHLTPHH